MLRLGNLELKNRFLLAPLESVSDCAFRRICWELGASFTFTEMIRARGLVRNNRSTFDLIDTFDPEVPTGLQLMVANEKELAGALDALEGSTLPQLANLSAVDLNFGCPSPEVIRIGAGPALLKRRGKLESIIRVLSEWKKSTSRSIKAVSVKLRLGLNRMEMDQKVVLPIVELANEHLDFLTIHARHARQTSDSPASWSALTEAKARATVPLIGNGDVLSAQAWQRVSSETGVDGALIARGAIRSPWIFEALQGRGTGEPPSLEVLEATRERYFALAAQYGTKPKFLEWHTEGFRRMKARLLGQQVDRRDGPVTENSPLEL